MSQMTKELPKREDVPEHLTWDLTTIFSTDEAWEEEYESLRKELPKIKQFQNTLHEGADRLLELLQFQDQVSERLGKLYVYAHMRYDQDTTNSFYQGLNQKAESLLAFASSEMSFIVPEILQIEEEKIRSFIEENEALKLYEKTLDEIIRQREHFLSERDRKSTRLNSSHVAISYAVLCLKKKNEIIENTFLLKRTKRSE